MTKITVTGFTDIEGFSSLVEKIGHQNSQPIVDEFLRVGKALIGLNGGQFIKEIGDSHMFTFDNLEEALQFSTQFQQYYQDQPCLQRHLIRVRIALCLGAVELVNEDVFGLGAISASRMEAVTEAGIVCANCDLVEKIRTAWGSKRIEECFERIGEVTFKGMSCPEELYAFRWGTYGKSTPKGSLAIRVYDCLNSAGMEFINMNVQDLSPPGLLIWPVVPRRIATSIHRCQIEIIRLLAFLGWHIKLLMADIGASIQSLGEEVCEFADTIVKYSAYREIKNIEVEYLSTYFEPKYPHLRNILKSFEQLTSDLSVQDLIDINQKQYSQEVKDKIKENPTLDFIRPILTCAAVVHLIERFHETNVYSKVTIVSGEDEQIQWRSLLSMTGPSQNLGIILHPTLKIRNAGMTHTARQTSDWPIWHSRRELERDMATTNAGKWVFQLLGQLPFFPAPYAIIEGKEVRASHWQNEFEIPRIISISEIVNMAWDKLDPSRGE